jgi:hypothetical protein
LRICPERKHRDQTDAKQKRDTPENHLWCPSTFDGSA